MVQLHEVMRRSIFDCQREQITSNVFGIMLLALSSFNLLAVVYVFFEKKKKFRFCLFWLLSIIVCLLGE